MKIDSLGVPRFTEKDLTDMIYAGHVDKCTQVLCDSPAAVEEFNSATKRFGLAKLTEYKSLNTEVNEFDTALQAIWLMPSEYQNINLIDYLTPMCNTQAETSRLKSELEEYSSRNLLNILRYMIYLVDFMRQNKILWGVGRGSSVASFVLYLIGIHRIHSIKYDLDFHEFMR